MRHLVSLCRLPGVLALLLLAGTPLLAQSDRYPLKIVRAQAGLPAGPHSGENDSEGGKQNIFKAGSWAPVWVSVDCLKEPKPDLVLCVETTDADEVTTRSEVPLPRMQPGERRTGYELGAVVYIKPGTYFGDIHVTIKDRNGRDSAEPYRKNILGLQQAQFAVCSIGASLSGFQLTSNNANGENTDPLRNGWMRLAQCVEANQLPDSWIGYKSFDLVVLCTGSDSNDLKFYTALGKDKIRLSALREWVMRGGKLMVSTGSNSEVLKLIPEIADILPATVNPTSKRTLDSVRLRFPRDGWSETLGSADSKVAVTKLEARPERPFNIIMPWADRADPNAGPLLVDWSYGTGRVFLSAFDLERPPLSNWRQGKEFWDKLIAAAGLNLPDAKDQAAQNRYYSSDNDTFGHRLQGALDSFEGVPVVSFGWVALFIFLYILLIGPVDYFILKKVFKRLEWTWITFPLIVISVSALAYYAAYAIKGRDMKINKIDLVQIDLTTRKAYGTTWFSVFSPRIQNYNVSVEPASGADMWCGEGPEKSYLNTVMGWQGTTASGRNSLLRRSYAYENSVDPANGRPSPAVGMRDVQIQVWSTKAFVGEWMVDLDKQKPLIEANFKRAAGDEGTILGTLKSNLPIEKLDDARLVYQGKDYPLGSLVRGEERNVTISLKDTNTNVDNWLKLDARMQNDSVNVNQYGYRPEFQSANAAVFRLWPLLFHDIMFGSQIRPRNAGYRSLDQSWRVDNQRFNEVVLLGRVPITEGAAEEWQEKPFSPTRLWLNGVPGQGTKREPLKGTLRQETCVVVTIPVLNK